MSYLAVSALEKLIKVVEEDIDGCMAQLLEEHPLERHHFYRGGAVAGYRFINQIKLMLANLEKIESEDINE